MNIRVLAFLGAAVASLTLGVVGLILSMPVLGLAAGGFGLALGSLAASLSIRDSYTQEQLARADEEQQGLRRDIDSLAGLLAEEHEQEAKGQSIFSPVIAPEDLAYDKASGLLEERFFAVMVQQRVSAARRQLQPVSVVLFELDGYAVADEEERNQALGLLGAAMRYALRESDTACVVGKHMAGAVLEDTTEAGAVWATERVRTQLMSNLHGYPLTVSAGVACYPTHALTPNELIDSAAKALNLARSHGKDQVEIAPHD